MKIPLSPPETSAIINRIEKQSPDRIARIIMETLESLAGSGYEHWDKVRHLPPPGDLTSEEWWLGLKLARQIRYKHLQFQAKDGRPFVVSDPDCVQRELHWITQHSAGNLSGDSVGLDQESQRTFLIKSLIDEAISSSQLEGASTTRSVAKEMIRQKREPRDNSERMIVNNYSAMEDIKNRKVKKLTPDYIKTLHRILTEDTLDDPSDAGVFRGNNRNIIVYDDKGNQLHVPPIAEELPERIEKICSFANDTDSRYFLHPIIKAIILHFMIGYDHPFVDGNGRVARALFYWYAITHGHWMLEYVSISHVIQKAPVQYGKAYLLTETDDGDITYFVIHQLGVIKEAINLIHENLIKERREISEVEALLNNNIAIRGNLNSRQLSLLRHAHKNPGQVYDIREHQSYHGVSYNSARTDLHALSDDYNLLEKYKSGKRYLFRSPNNLRERLIGP